LRAVYAAAVGRGRARAAFFFCPCLVGLRVGCIGPYRAMWSRCRAACRTPLGAPLPHDAPTPRTVPHPLLAVCRVSRAWPPPSGTHPPPATSFPRTALLPVPAKAPPAACAATDRRRARAQPHAPAGRGGPLTAKGGNEKEAHVFGKRSGTKTQPKTRRGRSPPPSASRATREGAARHTSPRRGVRARASRHDAERAHGQKKTRKTGLARRANPKRTRRHPRRHPPRRTPPPPHAAQCGRQTHTQKKSEHPSKISGQSHTHKRGGHTRVDCKKKGRWSLLGRASTRRRVAS